MAMYVVAANIRGKRIWSQLYSTRAAAQAYADKTNKYRRGANARVKKLR